MPDENDQYSAEEIARRIRAAVKGAFSGPPMPLKDIPKKNGESRTVKEAAKRPAKRPKTASRS